MALGARRREVVTLMLWQGGTPVLIGVVFGVALAQVTMPLLSSLLFEVSPTDVLTLAAVAGLLIVVTLPAIYLPAKRAASVDPLVVMRGE
jgi:putative ABC transport system permease protein